jgi:hypothetical protein
MAERTQRPEKEVVNIKYQSLANPMQTWLCTALNALRNELFIT